MSCAAPNPLHWEDLRNRDVDEILRKPGVGQSPEGNGYELKFLNSVYRVDTVSERIAEVDPEPRRDLTEEFQILLIRYLVSDYAGSLDGKEVSEKDFPGGVSFFQGPHALHVAPIVRLYGDNPEAFEKRGGELGAVAVPYGDKSMRFHPFPLVPVTYVLWKEDEEFPASITLLFDSSISRWFKLDMIFALVLVLTERIVEGQR
jgi:hypothetical protein